MEGPASIVDSHCLQVFDIWMRPERDFVCSGDPGVQLHGAIVSLVDRNSHGVAQKVDSPLARGGSRDARHEFCLSPLYRPDDSYMADGCTCSPDDVCHFRIGCAEPGLSGAISRGLNRDPRLHLGPERDDSGSRTSGLPCWHVVEVRARHEGLGLCPHDLGSGPHTPNHLSLLLLSPTLFSTRHRVKTTVLPRPEVIFRGLAAHWNNLARSVSGCPELHVDDLRVLTRLVRTAVATTRLRLEMVQYGAPATTWHAGVRDGCISRDGRCESRRGPQTPARVRSLRRCRCPHCLRMRERPEGVTPLRGCLG